MSKYDINQFKNVVVALNTPFKENGDVDYKAVRNLGNYIVNKGIKSVYVCGSTGEGFLLDNDERMKVVEELADEVRDQLKIIVHVGTPSTRHSMMLAKHAGEAGAHAISAVPNVYYRISEESIYSHWTKITEAADLPFFIYNIPALTGYALSMDLFNRMLENDRVAGVKCSSEAAHDILRFKQAGGRDFLVFSGVDEEYIAGRMMGADGGIGGTYAAMPELFLKIDDLINRGEYSKAQDMQNIITPFIYRLLGFPSLYGAVKTIIGLDGCPIGDPRLPFLPVAKDDPKIIQLYKDIREKVEETKNW